MVQSGIQIKQDRRKGERKKRVWKWGGKQGEGNEKAKRTGEEEKVKMTRPFLWQTHLLGKKEETRLTLKEDTSGGEKESKTVRTHSNLAHLDLLVYMKQCDNHPHISYLYFIHKHIGNHWLS